MRNYTMKIDDLILFFKKGPDDSQPTAAVLNKEAYSTLPAPSLPSGWEASVVSEFPTGEAENDVFYVVNLAKMLAPLGDPVPIEVSLPNALSGVVSALQDLRGGDHEPVSGDLVVVPYDDPTGAFLIPRAVYLTAPTLDDTAVPDLFYMVKEEGVLVANVPKLDVDGICCYLLATTNLKSGALRKP